MKTLLLIVATLLVVGLLLVNRLQAAEAISPQAAQERVAVGEAILVDVREEAEWQEGVAEPARLHALSDLRGAREQWQQTLHQAKHENKELVLYCRSGNRSAQAAAVLEKEGYRVSNAGSYAAWQEAGLPVRQPE
jgi:rhodanese-related sulfurtransferase